MTTVSVNWELAPEGTTHYMPENDDFYSSWLKRDAFGWQIWCNDNKKWCSGSWNLNKYLGTFIIKPAEEDRKVVWNGNGLPPAGTKCEFNLGAGEWCRVFVVGLDDDGCMVVQTKNDGYRCSRSPSHFRPIRTPEQIAEEEREKAIEEMVTFMKEARYSAFSTEISPYEMAKVYAEKLYQEGYRKENKND